MARPKHLDWLIYDFAHVNQRQKLVLQSFGETHYIKRMFESQCEFFWVLPKKLVTLLYVLVIIQIRGERTLLRASIILIELSPNPASSLTPRSLFPKSP